MTTTPESQEPTSQPTKTAVIVGLSCAVIAVVALVAIAVVLVAGGGDSGGTQPVASSSSHASLPPLPPGSPTPPITAPPANGELPSFTPPAGLGTDCQYTPSREPASKPVNPPKSGQVGTDPAQISAQMTTSQGPIGLTLDNAKSPCTVNSFVSLAKQGFLNNTPCHRLTTNPGLKVLQCGDPTGSGTGGPGYEFANEYPTDQYPPYDSGLKSAVTYPRGTVAMANAGPDTNGSQFFLVYGDSQLPPQYTVFGTINDAGLATLDKIAAGGVAAGGRGADDGAPARDVTITSVRVS